MTEDNQTEDISNNPFAWDGFYMEFADKLAEEHRSVPGELLARLAKAFNTKRSDEHETSLPIDNTLRYNCAGNDEAKKREFIEATAHAFLINRVGVATQKMLFPIVKK